MSTPTHTQQLLAAIKEHGEGAVQEILSSKKIVMRDTAGYIGVRLQQVKSDLEYADHEAKLMKQDATDEH